jgi:hypothetical protein
MRTRLTVVEELGLFAKARQGPIALEDDRGFERHRSGDHPRRVVPSDAAIVRRAYKNWWSCIAPRYRLQASSSHGQIPAESQLVPVIGGQHRRSVAPERRRTATDIDGEVENRAAGDRTSLPCAAGGT